jgi:SAM-dependent methyltransferase
MNICPLCENTQTEKYFQDKFRSYLKCEICSLVFVPESELLDLKSEKEIYDLHENDPNDLNYQKFMNRMITPFDKYIKGEGLDFGCGPGPVISTILKDKDVEIFEYDPIFKNDKSLLSREYDFIISTEVIEHIYESKKDFELILSLLRPLGALGLMTSFYPNDMKLFKSWGYKNDPTHVRFFCRETFEWISKAYELELEIPAKNIAILKRKNND